MFVDTSALVAILAREPDAAALVAEIERSPPVITAGHVLLEAAMRLATLLGVDPIEAESAIGELLAEARIDVVPITREIAHEAVVAFSRYGKGRRNRAQLNFGDCLSYACARHHDVPLLFKGDDFAATDIAPV